MSVADSRHGAGSMNIEEQTLSLAVSVLLGRMAMLSPADRDDLFALVKEIDRAESQEDVDGIRQSIMEIFDRRKGLIKQMDLGQSETNSPSFDKWRQWIGERVRLTRVEANLTQEALSEKSGLPQSHLSRIENGRLSPSRVTLERIAGALGKPVSHFDFN